MWTEKNKNAIVTGAGSGIGRALALELARRGANLAVTDIRADRLPSLVEEIRARGRRAEAFAVDHADRQAVADFFETFTTSFGRADILCLNAGVAVAGPVQNLTHDDWVRTLGVNVWGPVTMIELFVPGMIAQKRGGILITASGAGYGAIPGLAPYSASKYAMVGLAESLNAELGKYNIHVCALCPGVINTNIVSDSPMRFADGPDQPTKNKMVRFYKTWGTDPARVARDGLRGLAKNRCLQPSPGHAWAMYYFKRLAPRLYWALSRLAWKRGWIA
ncbi:MAG: SDR family NAD(P)-dependent oxidoreductase [Thermodesulfobacteriota bacterium]